MSKKYNKKDIGQRIKLIRLEKGLTLEEFGRLFDTSKGIISRWENGISIPNPERLKKIAELGDISIDYLLNGENISVDKKKLKKYIDFCINSLLQRDETSDYTKKAIKYFLNKGSYEHLIKKFYHDFTSEFYKSLVLNNPDEFYKTNGFILWLTNSIIAVYQNEVKSNENFIHHVESLIPYSVDDYQDYNGKIQFPLKNVLSRLTNELDIESATNLKDLHAIMYTYEKAVNEELIDEFNNLLKAFRKSLDELVDKYPDEKSEKVKRLILMNNENKVSIIDNGKTIQNDLEIFEPLNTALFNNIDFIVDEYDKYGLIKHFGNILDDY